MKSALLFTDVSIKGQSRGGHVNSVRSMSEFLKENFSLKVISLHDTETIIQKIVLMMYRLESKIYRVIYSLFFRTNPPCNVYKYSTVLCIYVFLLTRIKKYDFVIIEYIHLAYLRPFIRKGTKVVIDTIDIMHQRTQSYIDTGHDIIPSNSKISKSKELSILSKFDFVVVIQEDELNYLSQYIEGKVILAPRHFDISDKKNSNKNKVIGFIGGKADFNVDGISRFIKEIWSNPLVKKEGWQLKVYGQVCDELIVNNMVQYLNVDDVEFVGKVDDVSKAYEGASIMINPIYYGSGLKTKNVEALCHSKPLLTTTVGIQGMRSTLGNAVHLYNTVEDFSMALGRFENHEYLIEASKEANRIAKNNFSLHACYSDLNKAMQS